MATRTASEPPTALPSRAHEELRHELTEQFCAPIDAVPDPVAVVGAVRDDTGAVVDLQVRSLNRAALTLYGRSAEAVLGRNVLELFPTMRSGELWPKALAILDTGEPARLEVPFDDGGTRAYFDISAARFEDGLIITLRDVSARVEAQATLRRQRDLVDAMLRVAGALIVVLDSDWRIVRFNRACELLTGYREDDVRGRRIDFLVVEGERADLTADVLQSPRADEPISGENRVTCANGESRLVRWTNTQVRDADGTVAYTIGVGIEHSETEQLLRYERDLNRATLDVAGALIVLADADGRIVRFNRHCEMLTGFSEDEVIGRHYDFLFLPSERAVVAEKLALISPGHPVSQVNHYVTRSGAVRLMRWAHAPLVDSDGRLTHLVGVGIDITEQHTIEQELARRAGELERANRELARSNADLEQFAYVASHDLSEPLRAISGPLAAVAQRHGGTLDPESAQFLQFAVDGAQRMQQMVSGLLTFSRVARGEGVLGPVDSDRVARDAVTMLTPRLEQVQADVRIEGRLPVVAADPHQLGQVFANLIGNAVKFVAPGVTPHVRISADRAGPLWRFEVLDNGIGVPAEHRERIFVMFKRLPEAGAYEGTGIGLAVVKRIVERHGGEVGVADGPSGRGSCFWFTLPVAANAERTG